MKKLFAVVLLLGLIAGSLAAEENDYAVEKGDFFIGASIGLNYFSSSPVYGVHCEYILTGEIGIGKVGIGALARYWKWEQDVILTTYEFSYTFIGAQGNYHFNFGGPKLDLYAGVVIGYGIFDSEIGGVSESQLLFAFHAGLRWKISESFFVTARVGAGGEDFGGLEGGASLRL